MSTVDKSVFTARAIEVAQLYGIDKFVEEATLWYEVWANRMETKSSKNSVEWQMLLIDLLAVHKNSCDYLYYRVWLRSSMSHCLSLSILHFFFGRRI